MYPQSQVKEYGQRGVSQNRHKKSIPPPKKTDDEALHTHVGRRIEALQTAHAQFHPHTEELES
jgi:hypothetical protein